VTAVTLDQLAARLDVTLDALRSEFSEMEAAARRCEPDRFGRLFQADQLPRRPYCAVKVTGALFHTQGGMANRPEGVCFAPRRYDISQSLRGGRGGRRCVWIDRRRLSFG
jgi:hypothetical protein